MRSSSHKGQHPRTWGSPSRTIESNLTLCAIVVLEHGEKWLFSFNYRIVSAWLRHTKVSSWTHTMTEWRQSSIRPKNVRTKTRKNLRQYTLFWRKFERRRMRCYFHEMWRVIIDVLIAVDWLVTIRLLILCMFNMYTHSRVFYKWKKNEVEVVARFIIDYVFDITLQWWWWILRLGTWVDIMVRERTIDQRFTCGALWNFETFILVICYRFKIPRLY